jgi:hypothetical protein
MAAGGYSIASSFFINFFLPHQPFRWCLPALFTAV